MWGKKDVCRLCLSKEPEIDIFDDNLFLANKIQDCCGFEVFFDDGLPRSICMACHNTLDMVQTFRKKCKTNQNVLLKCQPRNKGIIKIEFESSMTFFEKPKAKHEFDIRQCNAETIEFKEDCMDDMENDSLENDSLENDSCNTENLKSKKKTKHITQKPKEKGIRKRKKRPSKLCPICGIVVKSAFSVHMKHHNGPQYICDYCNKGFVSKYNLAAHILLHQNNSVTCEFCGKVFSNQRYCTKHIYGVHNNKYICRCEICGKELKNRMSLKVHLLAHTGSKPYPCSLCNKMFRYKSQIQDHLREHTGEKPFKCRFCDSQFRIKGYLVAHERLHTGHAPYHCTMCPKQFAQLPNLKSHFRHNHKDVEFSYTYEK